MGWVCIWGQGLGDGSQLGLKWLYGGSQEIFKHYKSFKVTLKETEKTNGGSLVKWILDYEKVKDEIPAPQSYQDFAVNITEDLDAHLVNA
ncbi:hypothetical protein L3X38_006182 [Prunus dulcis]|nr:hypothetical protein L3X38_006182 [Prunus dulcis]